VSFFPRRGIAELRTITDTDRPHRATLRTVMRVTTTGGGWRESFTTLREAVPCRMSSITPSTGATGTRDQNVPPGATWRVVFAATEDLGVAKRLTITGTDDTRTPFTRELEVLRPPLPQTDSMLRVLYCVDVHPPAMAEAA
jgi:hypothetical protein